MLVLVFCFIVCRRSQAWRAIDYLSVRWAQTRWSWQTSHISLFHVHHSLLISRISLHLQSAFRSHPSQLFLLSFYHFFLDFVGPLSPCHSLLPYSLSHSLSHTLTISPSLTPCFRILYVLLFGAISKPDTRLIRGPCWLKRCCWHVSIVGAAVNWY